MARRRLGLFARVLLALACTVGGVAAARPAFAQGKAPPEASSGQGDEAKSPDEKRARVQARLKQVRRRILKHEVGLDDKKAGEVEKVFDKYEPWRQKLTKQQREQRLALRDLLKQNSDDEAAYKKALEAFRGTQKQLKTMTDREMDELAKLLSPKQQAKLFAALQRLRKQLARRAAESKD